MIELLTLELNGQQKQLTDLGPSPALTEVLNALGLKLDRIAVEQNGSIVRRADWTSTLVRQGDKLEVVHFVGGGCARRQPGQDREGQGSGKKPW